MTSKNNHGAAPAAHPPAAHDDAHDAVLEDIIKKAEQSNVEFDTAEHYSKVAYHSAVSKFLIGEDGNVMYNKLNDDAVNKQFAEHLVMDLRERAKAHYKSAETDVDKIDDLVQLYAGINPDALSKHIKTQKEKFNSISYQELLASVRKQRFENRLDRIVQAIEDEHVKYVVPKLRLLGEGDSLDPAKVSAEEAKGLVKAYILNDKVLPKQVYEGKVYHNAAEGAGTAHPGENPKH